MGKLVLFLADGSTMHVPLDKERLTLGRRADNDVCLPYPAVSGEHAVVVTILADSFLEDQGSTNGTLVNGKPTVKHFLRDHDQIEIGRQRLTYMSDDNARIEPLPPDIARSQLLGLTDRVEHQVRPVPKVVSGAAASSRAFPGGRSPALLDDLDQAFDASPVVTDGTSLGAGAVPARAAVASNNAQTSTTSRPRRAGSGMDVDATRVAPPEAPPVQRDHSASAPALAPQRLQPKREPAGNRTSPTVVATAVAAVRDP